jgi:CRISPR/Cas system CMR-associated protein Cmr5 small subunit
VRESASKKVKGKGYSSVVELFPSMHKTLGLISSTAKERKKKKKKNVTMNN